MNESLHFLQLCVGQVRDDAVKRVVNHSLAISLFHPGVESLMERLAFILNSEVDQGGCSAMCCCHGARFEVIRTLCSTERHVQMCMHIDTAGHHITVGGVDDLASIFRGQVF